MDYYLSNEELKRINMINSENDFNKDGELIRVDVVVEGVREKLLSRSQIGINKYGTTLEQNNKDNYLNHLQMELMDACNYLEKKLVQEEDIVQLVKLYPNDTKLGEQIRMRYG